MGHGFLSNIAVPPEAKIDHELKAEGSVKRHHFAAAVSGWRMGALIINLAGDEVPLAEGLERHFETQVPRETAFSRGRWLYRGDRWLASWGLPA